LDQGFFNERSPHRSASSISLGTGLLKSIFFRDKDSGFVSGVPVQVLPCDQFVLIQQEQP
jgi:hypothetical protein